VGNASAYSDRISGVKGRIIILSHGCGDSSLRQIAATGQAKRSLGQEHDSVPSSQTESCRQPGDSTSHYNDISLQPVHRGQSKSAFLPAPNSHHPLNCLASTVSGCSVDLNLMLHFCQTGEYFWKSDLFHVRTKIARADELDIGILHGNIVAHRAFSHHDHSSRSLITNIANHSRCRPDEICLVEHIRRTLWVGDNLNIRILLSERFRLVGREPLMDFAVPLPGDDLDICLSGNIPSEVFIGKKDNTVCSER